VSRSTSCTFVGSPVSMKAKHTTTQFRFVRIFRGSIDLKARCCELTGPRISRRVVLECRPYRYLFRSCQSQGYKHPNTSSCCTSQSAAQNAASRAEPCCAFRCCLFGARHSTWQGSRSVWKCPCQSESALELKNNTYVFALRRSELHVSTKTMLLSRDSCNRGRLPCPRPLPLR
jgi:hypothetical protein